MIDSNVTLENKVILITGAAGFIGSNLVKRLLNMYETIHIIGIDNMNDYYDVSIKEFRLKEIENIISNKAKSTWRFIKGSPSLEV